jgi:SNF2 family DNA or RNA helicase
MKMDFKLDYNGVKGTFNFYVPRSADVTVKSLMEDHGLNFSQPASTANTAVMFTREDYAAVTFREYATPAALARLRPLIERIDASSMLSSGAHIRCPADQELWDFQKASISYALNQKRTLVADQPGLGKTPIAICYANEIRAKRVLCVVPANIRGQWEKRIRQWTTMPWPYNIYPIYHGRHGVHPTANWTIVSYDLARSPPILAALCKGTYDLLILDEGHMLKNEASKRTRAVFGIDHDPTFVSLASRCGAVMVLTGTPLPNRPREAFVLAKNLCWDAIDFASEDDFRERFNPSRTEEGERWNAENNCWETFYYVDERTGRHAELQNRMRANFMTRHLKREVMPQLKMPVFDIIQLTETAAVKQALNAEKMLDIDVDLLMGADKAVNGMFAIARQQMGLALAPQIADYVEMLIDGGEEKLVLAGWHIAVLDVWCKQLEKYGIIRIDGSVGPKKKERLVEEFVKNPRVRIAIGNMQSMGTGTDGLQEVCNHVLIGEASTVPGENEQMVDRLDRGGQDRTVQADFFVAPDSLMERILASSLRKLTVTHAALDKKFAI